MEESIENVKIKQEKLTPEREVEHDNIEKLLESDEKDEKDEKKEIEPTK